MTPYKQAHLRMCCHVMSSSSVSKGVFIKRREPPKLGSAGAPPPCGKGVTDPLEVCSSSTCYPAEFGPSRSNGMNFIKEIHLKI